MFAGIQPYAYVGSDLYLLVGLEHDKWSGFAGGVEKEDKDLISAAAREGYEETMGVLGSEEELKKMICGGVEILFDNGSIFVFEIDYSSEISRCFNRFREYVYRSGYQHHQDGYFEKEEIAWVRAETVFDNSYQYRSVFMETFPEVLSVILSS